MLLITRSPLQTRTAALLSLRPHRTFCPLVAILHFTPRAG